MKKNCSNIGGQAVLEGVMMRGPETQAMAVRDSEGKIVIESTRFERSESRKKVAKIPIIRGIVSFFESFTPSASRNFIFSLFTYEHATTIGPK